MIWRSKCGGRPLSQLGPPSRLIADEYTHGVTGHVVKLEYNEEIGALDESLSDIFAILIANHSAGMADSDGWMWELGPGLGANGGPLRDLRIHTGHAVAAGASDEWKPVSEDHGGVHLLSGGAQPRRGPDPVDSPVKW